jgi:hypothetical protein
MQYLRNGKGGLLDYYHAGHRIENTGNFPTVACILLTRDATGIVLEKVGGIKSVMNGVPSECVLFESNCAVRNGRSREIVTKNVIIRARL